MKMEKINPMVIRFEDGETYTLEFNRKTVSEAENAGLKLGDASDRLMNVVPELFYFAFRMHHPNMKRSQTDKILFDDLGGLTEAQLERLIDLFGAPYSTLMNEGKTEKNAKTTVIL